MIALLTTERYVGVPVSDYLRYKFYGKSFSSLTEPARHHDKATSSATRIILTLINHLLSSLTYILWGFSFGFLTFFSLTLLTITQEGTIKKRKESDSVSQNIRSGQLLTLIIHRL